MKKKLFTVTILIFVIVASGCINDIENNAETSEITTKTYSANGISFNYPSNWKEINKTGNYTIAYLKDPDAKSDDNKSGAVVEISKKSSDGIPLKRYYEEVKRGAESVAGYELLSERTFKVDNTTAYEFVSKATDKDIEEQYRVVLLEKKGFIYMIACGTRSPTYLSDEEENFDIIINSFKVR